MNRIGFYGFDAFAAASIAVEEAYLALREGKVSTVIFCVFGDASLRPHQQAMKKYNFSS